MKKTSYDIIVIGAGLAAIYSLVELAKSQPVANKKCTVALVADKSDIIFNPLLYDFIVSEVPRCFAIIDLISLCKDLKVDLFLDTVTEVDTIHSRINTLNNNCIEYKVLVLALGSKHETNKSSIININHLKVQNLYELKKCYSQQQYLDVYGSGNSALEFYMKYRYVGKLKLKTGNYSQSAIPSLIKRVEGRINKNNMRPVRRAIHAYSNKKAVSITSERIDILNSKLKINEYLQTKYINVFCIGDQAVPIRIHYKITESAQVAYQYRKVLANNVLTLLNHRKRLIMFNPVNLGYMYTYGKLKSEVCILNLITISGRFGYILRLLVYLTRLPTMKLRVSTLLAFIRARQFY